MAIPDELKEYYASAPTNKLMWETLSFSHPSFYQYWHLTTCPEEFTAEVETGNSLTFIPGPISISQPDKTSEGRHDMAVGIAVIPEVISEVVRASTEADKPINLVYRQFLQEFETITQAGDPITLELNGLSVDVFNNTITGIAAFPDLVRKPFPSEVYRINTFPGLDRK